MQVDVRHRCGWGMGVTALLLVAAASLAGEEPGAPVEGRHELPLEVIGGVVVVKATIETPAGRVAGNFVVDLGSTEGLMLPEGQAKSLGLEEKGQATLAFDKDRLSGIRVSESKRADLVRQLSAENAAALGEVPALGLLGLGAFNGKAVELDIGAGVIRLLDPAQIAFASSVTVLVWEQTWPISKLAAGRMALDMLHRESSIAIDAMTRLKVGEADAPPAMLGETDLLRAAAYRPAAIETDLALGIGLLSQFRVTVDPAGRRTGFERLRAAVSAEGEQAYFIARHRGDPGRIAAFLRQYPEHPLANEAAIELLQLRLNGQGSAEELKEAVSLVSGSFAADKRAARLIALADDLISKNDAKFRPAVEALLDQAMQNANSDVDGRAVFAVHARRGVVALRAGDLPKARRLLTSASYGLRGDAQLEMWFGELYQAMGEPERAWLRFVDSATMSKPPAGAMRGLDKLVRSGRFQDAMPVSEIELMLEGRIPSFVPAKQRSADQSASVQVVELFVDDGGAGGVGQQLAFDGLRHYYRGTPTAFLAFHLGPAGNTALSVARAKYYGVKSLPMMMMDGQRVSDVPVGADGAAATFDDHVARTLVRNASTQPVPAPVRAEITATISRAEIRAEVTVVGASGELEAFVFLCQRRVFAIGGNGAVMHYAVARAQLGDADGKRISSGAAPKRWSVTATAKDLAQQIESDSDAARARQRPSGPSMRTVPLNLDECDVAIVVHDAKSRRIVAQAFCTPKQAEGAR